MALSDKQLHDCFQQRNRDKVKERRLIAQAIEAEVSKQDEVLIRQLVDALENSSDLVFKDTTKADARDLAITAARARLEGKP